MSSVHRCPVCMGKGIVPNGFYSSTSSTWTSSSTAPETCRSCGGRGVITVQDATSTPSRSCISFETLYRMVQHVESDLSKAARKR